MSLADTTVPVELTYIVDKLDNVTKDEIEEWREIFNNSDDDHPDPWGRMLFENQKKYEEIVRKHVMAKRLYQENVYTLIPEEDHSPFRQEILYLDCKSSNNINDNRNVCSSWRHSHKYIK